MYRLSLAALMATAFFISPSFAADYTKLEQQMTSLAEPASALEIEEQIFSLVRDKNQSGIASLAQDIERQDGNTLAEFQDVLEEISTNPEASQEPDLSHFVLSIGPCHQANILIRHIALALSNQDVEAEIKDGSVSLSQPELGASYNETIKRCILLKKLPARTILIHP